MSLPLHAPLGGAFALVLAGCASAPPLNFPPDHPANPQATAALADPTPSVLTTYRPAGTQAASRPEQSDGEHSGHPASRQDMPGMQKEDPHAGHR